MVGGLEPSARLREISAHGGVADAANGRRPRRSGGGCTHRVRAEKAGEIDISFNAVTPLPRSETQGIPIAEPPVDRFLAPINLYMRTQFLTARAAARRMAKAAAGVILMNTPEPARISAGSAAAWRARLGGDGGA